MRYKNHVFITMQKCGGTSIRRNLEGYGDPGPYQHLGAAYTERRKNDTFYGVCRNPYAWYTSVYYFGRKHKHPLCMCSFEKMVVNLIDNPTCLLSPRFSTFNPDIQPTDKGGMTFLFHQLFYKEEQCLIDEWIRLEDLTSRMQEITGLNLFQEKLNPSTHPPYQEIYSSELRDRVAQNDAEYLKQFNYRYEL